MDWSAFFHDLIGRTDADITWWQMSVRAVVIFLFGLILLRLADRRAFGKSAALDFLLAVIIGSNLSRALTASAPFVPTLAATAVLVALHWLLALAAFRWKPFAALVKGKPLPLVEDGRIDWSAMRRQAIGRRDLEEAMREAGVTEMQRVGRATLERDGEISIVKRDSE